jgi:hypothetical protein
MLSNDTAAAPLCDANKRPLTPGAGGGRAVARADGLLAIEHRGVIKQCLDALADLDLLPREDAWD